MEQRVVVEIFHARMHTEKDNFSVWSTGMSVEDFIDNNRELLRKISKKFLDDYNLNSTSISQMLLRKSIRRYLEAEGVKVL